MLEKGPEIQDSDSHNEAKKLFAKTYKYLASLAKGVSKFAEELTEDMFGPMKVSKRLLKKALKEKTAIHDALNSLKDLSAYLEKKEIVLKDIDYYMAIALKESHFDPLAISNASRLDHKTLLDKKSGETAEEYKERIKIHAFGALQIKPGALSQVNEVFGTNYKLEDIFYIPKETDDPVDSQIEDVKLSKAMETNAVVAILYWHYCRDIAPAKGMGKYDTKVKFKDPIDQDKFAALVYNYGPARAGTLFKATETYSAYKASDPSKIKSPETYKEFEEIAAQLMAEISGIKKLKEQKNGRSRAYSIFFKTFFGKEERAKLKDAGQLPIYRPTKGKKKQHMDCNPMTILAALDYSSVIHSIRKGFYFSETETVCLAEYDKK